MNERKLKVSCSSKNHAWNRVSSTAHAPWVTKAFEAADKHPVRTHTAAVRTVATPTSKTKRGCRGTGYGKHTVNSRLNRRNQ